MSGNNGLFYFHSDHPSTTLRTSLGSATFLTHGNGHGSEGNKVANSTKFYTPFGEYRIQPPDPTDDITDRGFTGHRHNDYIKLIYMGSRYFCPILILRKMSRNQQVSTIGIIISVLGVMVLFWAGTRLFFGKCILLNCPPVRTFTVLDLGLQHNLFPQDSYGNPIHRPSGKLGAQDSGIMTIYWRQGNGLAVYNVWEYGTEKLASNLYQTLIKNGENISNNILLSYQSELADEQKIGCGFSQFGSYRCVFIARYTEFVLSFNVAIDEEMPIEKFEEAVIYIDRQMRQKLFPE